MSDLKKRSVGTNPLVSMMAASKKKKKEERTCPICQTMFNYDESFFAIHVDACLSNLSNTTAEEVTVSVKECTPGSAIKENESRPTITTTTTSSSDEKSESQNKNHNLSCLADIRLFDIHRGPLPGLYYIHNFISTTEESLLLNFLDNDVTWSNNWHQSAFSGKCMSKMWGLKTEHSNQYTGKSGYVRLNDAKKGEFGLPPSFSFILDRLKLLQYSFQSMINSTLEDDYCRNSLFSDGSVVHQKNSDSEVLREFSHEQLEFNECNANSYMKAENHYLRPHVDDRQLSGPLLANLSLLSEATMRFNPERQRDKYVDVRLPPRTLQIVSGRARYYYEHSIPNDLLSTERRVSLTFRSACSKHGVGIRGGGASYAAGTNGTKAITEYITANNK